MRNKTIFPIEIAEFTAEYHFQEHHTQSKMLYRVILLAIVIAFISLFYVKVSVSVNGAGILTSANERNIIKAPISGKIEKMYVKLNQQVKAGDILFTIQTNLIDEQSAYLTRRSADLQYRIRDLETLTKQINTSKLLHLSTPIYRQQQALYLQQLAEAELQYKNAALAYGRNNTLHDKRVLSDAEFEKFNYEYQTAIAKKKLLIEQQASQWQNDLVTLRTERADLDAQHGKYSQERDLYSVKSPINGSIQQFNGLLPNNFVALGETVAEISPDSGLIATVNIAPKDIGLLAIGMPVRYQIDAFNYNEWGNAHGSVYDISKDVHLDENKTPYFQAKCFLKESALQLTNGYEGRLKKGMSFQARFQVTERTVFQLLYDKMDDWLNPAKRTQEGT